MMRGSWMIVMLCAWTMMSALNGTVGQSLAAIGEPDVKIVMTHRMFKVTKGGGEIGQPMFRLEAGKYTTITLENRDKVAHEFVSPLFRMTEVHVGGEATMIWTDRAAGVRVEPGKSVELKFWVPRFINTFEPFWCNVHGKEHGSMMRGEVVVAGTR
ncbi:MAG: hypothetical protein D6690_07780 [Nitrospirae bacterium]|nr:MAG: hypothetical protein D6690_07780 [Nitrospirota bacterium]